MMPLRFRQLHRSLEPKKLDQSREGGGNIRCMKRTHTKHQGFTIVELLIVIVVIGILAAVSIVAYNNMSNKATDSRLASESSQVLKGVKMRLAESGNLDLPPSVNNANALADYMYYQPLGDKVLITAYNYNTNTAIIGSEADMWGDFSDKTKLSVHYSINYDSISIEAIRWSHQNKKYEYSAVTIETNGSISERSGSYDVCDLTPDADECDSGGGVLI